MVYDQPFQFETLRTTLVTLNILVSKLKYFFQILWKFLWFQCYLKLYMSDTIIDVGFKDFSAKRMSKCSQGIFHRVVLQDQIPTHLGLMK